MPVYDLNGKNKYYKLYSLIREDILRGKWKAGEKLPPKREMAKDSGVSVVTVQLAYEQLLAEGYITSRERSGYFVEKVGAPSADDGECNLLHRQGSGRRALQTDNSAPQGQFKIDFVKGSAPAELFPFSVWTKLMRRVLADCGEHLLERVPCDGDFKLKEEISRYLYRARGIDTDPQRIVIGAGAEYLYGVIVQLLGRDKVFAVENPGYTKISRAYALNGAFFTPVTVKTSGICLDELKKSGADALHISPSHQFPTGAVTPAGVRSQIISWAAEGDRYVIEDDYDSEFRLAGKPLQSLYSLQPEKVIYMNTFSKSLAPSMRMGYMVLPTALYNKFLELFSHSANVVPLFEQKTLAEMLGGGYFERHIARMRNYYKGVRRALLEKFSSSNIPVEIMDTGSGLHMIVRFYNASSDDEIKRAAAERGINIRCLSDYLIAPVEGVERCAVLNYSGVTCGQLEQL